MLGGAYVNVNSGPITDPGLLGCIDELKAGLDRGHVEMISQYLRYLGNWMEVQGLGGTMAGVSPVWKGFGGYVPSVQRRRKALK